MSSLAHPNLVRLLDAGRHSGVPYLVLELVEGLTLAQRLRRGPLSLAQVHRVGRDIAGALGYLHAQGVVHRDVKPSNILLAPDGRVLLSDLGVARLSDGSHHTAPDATIGTAAYLAPEHVGAAEVSGAADVYSLGLVLTEALTGRSVFAGAPSESLAARLARDPGIPADLPAPWPRLLSAMTRRDPTSRPAAAGVAAQLRTTGEAETAEVDRTITAATAVMGGVPAELDTAELDEVPTEHAVRRAPPATAAALSFRSPELRPLLGLAAAFVALVVLAVFVFAAGQGTDDDDRAGGPATDVTAASTTTTSATTTLATTTTAPAPSQPEGVAPADACADLEARKQAIEAQKQQVEERYRDDRETRERVKDQLDAEKQAIDEQKQALGC